MVNRLILILGALPVLAACAGGAAVVSSPSSAGHAPSLTRTVGDSESDNCLTSSCIYVLARDSRLPHNKRSPYVVAYPANVDKTGRFRKLKPVQVIGGRNTGMSASAGLAVDASRAVYVVNASASGSITIYAPGASGDVAPIRTISGPSTDLGYPDAIAVDSTGKIYVANLSPAAVTVYASDANGDSAPVQQIVGSLTGISRPVGVAVDASDQIYVASEGTSAPGSVEVFAAGATGNLAPVQEIAGSDTGLTVVTSIAVDADRNIYTTGFTGDPYVSCVNVYPAGATGDVPPARVITGSLTEMNTADSIAVDSTGKMYLANRDGDHKGWVTSYAPGATGNASPLQWFTGKKPTLIELVGVSVE